MSSIHNRVFMAHGGRIAGGAVRLHSRHGKSQRRRRRQRRRGFSGRPVRRCGRTPPLPILERLLQKHFRFSSHLFQLHALLLCPPPIPNAPPPPRRHQRLPYAWPTRTFASSPAPGSATAAGALAPRAVPPRRC